MLICRKLHNADKGNQYNLNKWRGIGICGLKDSTKIIKVLILPKSIYRFNGILIKISDNYFVDMDKIILKFQWKDIGTRIPKQF